MLNNSSSGGGSFHCLTGWKYKQKYLNNNKYSYFQFILGISVFAKYSLKGLTLQRYAHLLGSKPH